MHGIIRTGFVGKATYAVSGKTIWAPAGVEGLTTASGGLTEPLLTTFDFGVVVVELVVWL